MHSRYSTQGYTCIYLGIKFQNPSSKRLLSLKWVNVVFLYGFIDGGGNTENGLAIIQITRGHYSCCMVLKNLQMFILVSIESTDNITATSSGAIDASFIETTSSKFFQSNAESNVETFWISTQSLFESTNVSVSTKCGIISCNRCDACGNKCHCIAPPNTYWAKCIKTLRNFQNS